MVWSFFAMQGQYLAYPGGWVMQTQIDLTDWCSFFCRMEPGMFGNAKIDLKTSIAFAILVLQTSPPFGRLEFTSGGYNYEICLQCLRLGL